MSCPITRHGSPPAREVFLHGVQVTWFRFALSSMLIIMVCIVGNLNWQLQAERLKRLLPTLHHGKVSTWTQTQTIMLQMASPNWLQASVMHQANAQLGIPHVPIAATTCSQALR